MKNLFLLLFLFSQFALAKFGENPHYIVYCPSKNNKISFEIWRDENQYEIRKLVFQNQNTNNATTIAAINVVPAIDQNSLTSFYELQAQINSDDLMTLTDIPGDLYRLTLQSKQFVDQYLCTVGIPKPGVIISN